MTFQDWCILISFSLNITLIIICFLSPSKKKLEEKIGKQLAVIDDLTYSCKFYMRESENNRKMYDELLREKYHLLVAKLQELLKDKKD